MRTHLRAISINVLLTGFEPTAKTGNKEGYLRKVIGINLSLRFYVGRGGNCASTQICPKTGDRATSREFRRPRFNSRIRRLFIGLVTFSLGERGRLEGDCREGSDGSQKGSRIETGTSASINIKENEDIY